MRIAAAQIVSSSDPAANLELIRSWSASAAEAGARVVVFPEATHCQFGHRLDTVAEPIEGPWAQEVRKIAHETGLVIVVGMFTPATPSDSGRARVANTALAVGPGVEASYQKIHLYDAFGFKESDTVAPGEHPVQFTVEGICFGLGICYDIRFPQLFTAYGRAGTHVTVLPTSWGAGPGKVEQWQVLSAARALDSSQYVVACDQADPAASNEPAPEGAPTGVGYSRVVSPFGAIVAEAGAHPELVVAEVDPELVAEARTKIPVLENAREIPQQLG